MEPETYERVCRVCGRVFLASHGSMRLCGEACRRERNRYHLAKCLATLRPGPARKQCVICGTAFLAGKTEARPRQSKTCSAKCQVALVARHAAQRWLKTKAGRTRICVECGAPFRATDRPQLKTCSESCAQHRRRDQIWRHQQVQKHNGQRAMYEARRRASGYMKQYKRQWRIRCAEDQLQSEFAVLKLTLATVPDSWKGDLHGDRSGTS
jgi:hypothetical protein